ncbi:hypothetical protein GLOTRDRAFT_93459 [Gloeophyllum trabeum ATCC 11539]|uniref:Uncharacterized protein n=1 Tax=Gloeophyllum trabeum (strain ATCC 11539 / FP-39264 / Madison 617) TaxID=670483 RepID=S7RNA4_GLOTA|nr:uncharacterized protein GLOTRDRAFT_93459 [Gloeophyllum trabeum ATCC 11539]EPQ55945.1 hypothetical protein GLOTRDRAFT_93459 [Gloeophyllum trabeum ATCC 11539]
MVMGMFKLTGHSSGSGIRMDTTFDSLITAEITAGPRQQRLIEIKKGRQRASLPSNAEAERDAPTDISQEVLILKGVTASNNQTKFPNSDPKQPEEAGHKPIRTPNNNVRWIFADSHPNAVLDRSRWEDQRSPSPRPVPDPLSTIEESPIDTATPQKTDLDNWRISGCLRSSALANSRENKVDFLRRREPGPSRYPRSRCNTDPERKYQSIDDLPFTGRARSGGGTLSRE